MSARPPADHQIAVSAAIIAGTALVAIAIVFLILAILQLRADALEEARRNITNLALVLSEQTARVFQVVDLELKDLQDRIAHSDIRTAEEFRLLTVGPDFHFDLRQKALRLTQTDSFAAISAHGLIINSSRADGDLGLDVTGRDYFTSLKQNSSDDLFVSAPTLDRSNGKSIIVLGRRVMTANGTFLGIFIATFPLQHFEEIYSAFDLPHGESFLLVRRDGTVLVRHPDPKRRAGETMPSFFAMVSARS